MKSSIIKVNPIIVLIILIGACFTLFGNDVSNLNEVIKTQAKTIEVLESNIIMLKATIKLRLAENNSKRTIIDKLQAEIIKLKLKRGRKRVTRSRSRVPVKSNNQIAKDKKYKSK